jgi:hypothetical protein
MAELILNELNTEITPSNELKYTNMSLNDINACAVYELSVNLFKYMFMFQIDLSYNETNKIKYYTFANPDFNFLLSQSKLDNELSFGAIASMSTETMIIAIDYTRYLALNLFGTHLGIDLFVNEQALVNDITNKLNNAMLNNYNITQQINAIDGIDGSLNTDINETYEYDFRINRYVKCYTKFFLDDNMNNYNLCRELMLQLLINHPERFQSIQNTPDKQAIPFIAGDSISFKIGINAAQNQELLMGINPIQKRTYQIKILLNDSVYRTIPNRTTSAILNYTGSNILSPTLQFVDYTNLNVYDYILFKISLFIQSATSHINDATNAYLTTYIQIYPKAFPSNGIITFPFNNLIDGNGNYEIDNNATLPHGRIFYLSNLVSVNNASNYITIKNNNNNFIFEINPNANIINFQIQLENNGILPTENISSNNFDINFI